MKDYFKSLLEKSDINLEDSVVNKLMEYLHLLVEKNKVFKSYSNQRRKGNYRETFYRFFIFKRFII